MATYVGRNELEAHEMAPRATTPWTQAMNYCFDALGPPHAQSFRTTNSCGGGSSAFRAISRTMKLVSPVLAYLRRGARAVGPRRRGRRRR